MSVPYESLYGSPLLDEIHNHFPALLYAPDEFSNMREVLRYIQEQTRSRYDLFSFGLRRYRESASRAPMATSNSARTSYAPTTPAPAATVNQRMGRVATRPVPSGSTIVSEEYEEDEEGNTVTATFRITEAAPPPQPTRTPTATTTTMAPSLLTALLSPPVSQEETRAAQVLLSLLGQPTTTRPMADSPFWNQFFQPVAVRPTAEQIRQFTTIGQVPANIEVCTVCQDTFEGSRQGRKLNPCGHWFHTNCIDTWFQRNVRCPVCRHDIRTPASPVLSGRPGTNPPSQGSTGGTNP